MEERRRRLASGNSRPEVCSSSVTDSSCADFWEYVAGFKVEAAVLRSRPSIVTWVGCSGKGIQE